MFVEDDSISNTVSSTIDTVKKTDKEANFKLLHSKCKSWGMYCNVQSYTTQGNQAHNSLTSQAPVF